MSQLLLGTQESPSNNLEVGEPLKLNVYDLTTFNGYTYWVGLGVYHSGIEAYSMEFAYGAHGYSSSGVFEVDPQQCPGFKFRKSICVGTLWIGPERFREFMEDIACEYTGDSYHLLFKNCNHFSDDVCVQLVNSHIPHWVNRLARLGSLCSCCLPDALQQSALDNSEYDVHEDDAICSQTGYYKLAGAFSIVPPKKRQLMASSESFICSQTEIFPPDWNDQDFLKRD